MTFYEAATYAASYLDGLDQGLGRSYTIIDVDVDDKTIEAATRKKMDVETYILTAVVIGMWYCK